MPIEPVKIPQNVQIADRIVGPISLKQIVLCMIGGGLSYVLWNTFKMAGAQVNLFNMMIAWSPLTIAAAFAFVKVHNLTLLKIVLLALEKWDKPVKRTFGPRGGVAINIRTYFHTQSKKKAAQSNLDISHDKLDNLSSLLDESAQKYDPTKEMNSLSTENTTEEVEVTPPAATETIMEEPSGSLAQTLAPKKDPNAPLMNDIIPPQA